MQDHAKRTIADDRKRQPKALTHKHPSHPPESTTPQAPIRVPRPRIRRTEAAGHQASAETRNVVR